MAKAEGKKAPTSIVRKTETQLIKGYMSFE